MTTKEPIPIDLMIIRLLRAPTPDARFIRTAPIRAVCAWCRAVMVDVPGDLHCTSHGICESCAATEAARR